MLSLGMITLVVDEYDKAIDYYVNRLGFELIEDTSLTKEKRWVVLSPGNTGAKILLAKATTEMQVSAIGNSTGGRVSFFIYTKDFDRTYKDFIQNEVDFTELPRTETYGRVVVFKDCYGNKWDLIEKKNNE
jgi:catechol 2,3-dioxygenase-like lactoylglutathione lyase family enzyme